jgi:hypothetical protein
MPLPTRKYVDLTLYDRNPKEVYLDALTDLQTKLPDWVPREGNTEVLLLQTLALEISELIFVINRLPSGIVEIVLKMMGLTRDPGAQPQVTALFTVVNGNGYTIPAGTALRLDLVNGLPPITFLTTVDLIIPPGSTTGTVLCTAILYTADANGIAIGTALDLIDTISYVQDVETASLVYGGINPEDGKTFLDRGVNRLARLSSTLVLPSHFVAYAEEFVEITKAFAIDNYDASADIDGDGPVGDDPGHISVAVYGTEGFLSTDFKNDLENEMEAQSLANLIVHVIDPTITEIDVDVQVKRLPTYSVEEVVANVTTAVQNYINAQNWDWSDTLRRNSLISVIDLAEGVDYVDTLTTPAANVTLDGVACLVTLGDLNVVVV